MHSCFLINFQARSIRCYLVNGCFCIVINMSMRSDAPKAQKAFYNSKEWKRCRESYLARVGGLCERCEKTGIIRPAKIVHHKEYIDIDNITDPMILLSFDNLEAVCQTCHNNEHHANNKRYIVDKLGRVDIRY